MIFYLLWKKLNNLYIKYAKENYRCSYIFNIKIIKHFYAFIIFIINTFFMEDKRDISNKRNHLLIVW